MHYVIIIWTALIGVPSLKFPGVIDELLHVLQISYVIGGKSGEERPISVSIGQWRSERVNLDLYLIGLPNYTNLLFHSAMIDV